MCAGLDRLGLGGWGQVRGKVGLEGGAGSGAADERVLRMKRGPAPSPCTLHPTQQKEGPEHEERVRIETPAGWKPSEDWDSAQRKAALAEAEARGELRVICLYVYVCMYMCMRVCVCVCVCVCVFGG